MQQLHNCPICNASSISSYIKTTAQMHSSKELFNFDQCAECQMVFLNPRVDLDNLKNYYTSHYLPYRGSEAWGKFKKLVQGSQKKLDLKRVKRVKEMYPMSPESLILDVGCGNPSFLKACKQELNCQAMGIDFSDEGWKEQESQFKGLDLQVAEIKDLSVNLQPDVITMWHYLEHDYTPLENLTYLNTIAKPSTTLIIEIPNFDSISRKKYNENWAGWHTPRHTSLFSPNNIKLLLDKSGWNVSQLLTHGTLNPYLLFWMSEMEQKEIQWTKNMENEFWNFMTGMLQFLPTKWNEKKSSLGIMTIIATPK
jgi:2-polyprenyl-3-methyl-5-hydroxy-6-metoxy-1,4-benzoquinol methylase